MTFVTSQRECTLFELIRMRVDSSSTFQKDLEEKEKVIKTRTSNKEYIS